MLKSCVMAASAGRAHSQRARRSRRTQTGITTRSIGTQFACTGLISQGSQTAEEFSGANGQECEQFPATFLDSVLDVNTPAGAVLAAEAGPHTRFCDPYSSSTGAIKISPISMGDVHLKCNF
ncbi:uncharacterized protein LOC144158692 isoform X3 [Haemaphysalis longicornis]